MIDFLKILIIDEGIINLFRNDERLIFHNKSERLSHFDFTSIYARESFEYKGILFCFFNSKLEILFRPHYYFNDNVHNANDFTVSNCIDVLNEFIEDFEIHSILNKFQIINIEYGINAVSPISSKDLITYTIYHQRNQFVNDVDLSYSKKSFKSNNNGTINQYKIIKFYAKGLQFPKYANRNLIRFEVKSKKSGFINALGIYNLNDLLSRETYQELRNSILNEFREVLIIDNDNVLQNLNKRQKGQLKKYLNTNHWYKVLQGHRNSFSQQKKRYNDLLDLTGWNIHIELYSIFKIKLDDLFNETCAYLPPLIKIETCAYLPNSIMENCTYPVNGICPITGISLEHENQRAKYIKTTTLIYLRDNDSYTFRLLIHYLLDGMRKRPKFEDDIITHLAKQVRNRFYNPKRLIHHREKNINQLSIRF